MNLQQSSLAAAKSLAELTPECWSTHRRLTVRAQRMRACDERPCAVRTAASVVRWPRRAPSEHVAEVTAFLGNCADTQTLAEFFAQAQIAAATGKAP